jgi:hypothetical protein
VNLGDQSLEDNTAIVVIIVVLNIILRDREGKFFLHTAASEEGSNLKRPDARDSQVLLVG